MRISGGPNSYFTIDTERLTSITMFAFLDTRPLLILIMIALILAVGIYVLLATRKHR